jgi:hypothetical protein
MVLQKTHFDCGGTACPVWIAGEFYLEKPTVAW